MNEINIDPSIDLIIGPMFSGKSTELLRRLVIYKEIFSRIFLRIFLEERAQF